jgi:hypothetical protein
MREEAWNHLRMIPINLSMIIVAYRWYTVLPRNNWYLYWYWKCLEIARRMWANILGNLKKWRSYIMNKSLLRLVLKCHEATFIFIWIKEERPILVTILLGRDTTENSVCHKIQFVTNLNWVSHKIQFVTKVELRTKNWVCHKM